MFLCEVLRAIDREGKERGEGGALSELSEMGKGKCGGCSAFGNLFFGGRIAKRDPNLGRVTI